MLLLSAVCAAWRPMCCSCLCPIRPCRKHPEQEEAEEAPAPAAPEAANGPSSGSPVPMDAAPASEGAAAEPGASAAGEGDGEAMDVEQPQQAQQAEQQQQQDGHQDVQQKQQQQEQQQQQDGDTFDMWAPQVWFHVPFVPAVAFWVWEPAACRPLWPWQGRFAASPGVSRPVMCRAPVLSPLHIPSLHTCTNSPLPTSFSSPCPCCRRRTLARQLKRRQQQQPLSRPTCSNWPRRATTALGSAHTSEKQGSEQQALPGLPGPEPSCYAH